MALSTKGVSVYFLFSIFADFPPSRYSCDESLSGLLLQLL